LIFPYIVGLKFEPVDLQWNPPIAVKVHDVDWSRNKVYLIVVESPMSYYGQSGRKSPLKVVCML
jgi:hypothetical protein